MNMVRAFWERVLLKPLKWIGLALIIIGIAALLLWLTALYDSGVTP